MLQKYSAILCVLISLLCGCKGSGGNNSNNNADESSTSGNSSTNLVVNDSLALSWSSPDYDNNGQPITPSDISGYQIRYRLKGGAYQILTTPASQTAIDIEVASGIYEIEVAAIDNSGIVGDYIGPVIVQVEAPA